MQSNFNVPPFNPGYVFHSESVNPDYLYSSVTFPSTAISSNNLFYQNNVCPLSSGLFSNATMSSNNSYYQDYLNYYSGFTKPAFMATSFAQTPQYTAPGYQYNANSTAQQSNSPCYSASSTYPDPFQFSTTTPPAPSTTPPVPATTPPAQKSQRPERKCSHCSTTETCQWRNVRSKNGVLCNACDVYKRQSLRALVRPVEIIEKYKTRRANKLKSTH